jgi:membrane protease YdiL (CAAX protease family)
VTIQQFTRSDAILLAVLAIVLPALSYYAGLRISRGALPSRFAAYARTTACWWLIAATALVMWVRLDRPLSALGLTIPHDARSVVGIVLCILMLAYMNGQWRVIRRFSAEKRLQLRDSFGRLAPILPQTPFEYRSFIVVAITAGVCEELLYRGYLFAAAAPLVTLAGALAGGALIFGLGHAYQGPRGILKTTVAGLVFGIIYLATGSLLWPAILHALLDIQAGTVAYRLHQNLV